jgi:hypothetical protein
MVLYRETLSGIIRNYSTHSHLDQEQTGRRLWPDAVADLWSLATACFGPLALPRHAGRMPFAGMAVTWSAGQLFRCRILAPSKPLNLVEDAILYAPIFSVYR